MLTINESVEKEYWDFIAERQEIWYRRFVSKSSFPWTKDPVLSNVSFTNIYRRLDPGTDFVVSNILESLELTKVEKFWNNLLYRVIGRQRTFEILGTISFTTYEAKNLEKSLRFIKFYLGQSPFSIAYLVPGFTFMEEQEGKMAKISKVFDLWRPEIPAIWKTIEKAGKQNDLQKVFSALLTLPGIGQFFAYQVMVDMSYSLKVFPEKENEERNFLNCSADSMNSWVKAGPGARKGIQILSGGDFFEGKVRGGLSFGEAGYFDKEYIFYLHGKHFSELTKRNFKWLRKDFTAISEGFSNEIVQLSVPDIQNTLCEFHKYHKISAGTGKGRRKYTLEKLRPAFDLEKAKELISQMNFVASPDIFNRIEKTSPTIGPLFLGYGNSEQETNEKGYNNSEGNDSMSSEINSSDSDSYVYALKNKGGRPRKQKRFVPTRSTGVIESDFAITPYFLVPFRSKEKRCPVCGR